MVDVGTEVEVEIERLAAGGDGVGHLPDGLVVFVPLSAPGDRLRVRVTERRARFARAQLLEILRASALRRDPRCAHFGHCGGCAWQHIDDAEQLLAKQTIVSDALRRIGALEPPEIELTPSPSPFGYRGRARLVSEQGRLGYRVRGSTELCPVDACPVLVPELEAARAELASRVASDRPPGSAEWELARGAGGCVHVTRLSGAEAGKRLRHEVGSESLRVSSGGFLQSNSLLVDTLCAALVREAGSGDRLLELFAGAGTFTLALARCFAEVVAVEGDRQAARDLRANAIEQGRTGIQVRNKPVATALRELAEGSGGFDALVLDPPRAGLEKGSLAWLRALSVPRVVYLSCDPATLARDLRELCAAGQGYRLARVQVFDLFPQTPHIEVLASLRPV